MFTMPAVCMLLFTIIPSVSSEKLVSFGVTVGTLDKGVSPTSGAVHTLSVWFNQNVYQCTVTPSISTTYTCDSSSWTFMGCDTSAESEGAKILIENGNGDGSNFGHIFITTTGNGTTNVTYGIHGFCAIDSASMGRYQGRYMTDGQDSLCDNGFTHFVSFCIDNEFTIDNSCGPSRQLLYFDTTQPGTIANALWKDGTGMSISTDTSEECANPTNIPTSTPSLPPTSAPSSTNPTTQTTNPTAQTTNPTAQTTNPTRVTPSPTTATTNPTSQTSNPTSVTTSPTSPTQTPTGYPTLNPITTRPTPLNYTVLN
eukprot:922452_1